MKRYFFTNIFKNKKKLGGVGAKALNICIDTLGKKETLLKNRL